MRAAACTAALAALLPLGLVLAPRPLRAQGCALHLALEASAIATDNANHAAAARAQSDLITLLQPSLGLEGRCAALRLKATLGADLVASAQGSRPGRALVHGQADATATLLPRLLFLDAAASVLPVERDPFGPRSETGSSDNRALARAWRVSPFVEHALSPRSQLQARYEETGSRTDAGPGSPARPAAAAVRQRFSNLDLQLAQHTLPLGGMLAYSASRARFEGAASGDSRTRFESVSARGDLALAGDWVLGPVLGHERSRLLFDERADTLYGLHAGWRPSERTQVAAQLAHRFFGTGWQMDASHRTSRLSLLLQWRREPVTTPASLGVAEAGTRLDEALDAMLATRQPDPAARRALVAALMAQRGLPAELQQPVDVQAAQAQRRDSLRATALLMDRRNTLSLAIWRLTLQTLAPATGGAGLLAPAAPGSRQWGADLVVSRRLAPHLTLEARATWSSIRSVDDQAGTGTGTGTTTTPNPDAASRERRLHLALARALAPRTSVSLGLAQARFDTTSPGLDAWRARSVLAGLRHRF